MIQKLTKQIPVFSRIVVYGWTISYFRRVVYIIIMLLMVACKGMEKSITKNGWVHSYSYSRPVYVTKLAMDLKGYVWAAITDSQSGAISDFMFKRLNCDQCQPVHLPPPPLMARFYISAMTFDDTGQLWVVVPVEGMVYRQDLKGEWHSYPAEYSPTSTASHINIVDADLVVDNTGQAWVAPLLGEMFTIDPSTGKETLPGLEDASNLTRDYQGRIWATTIERSTTNIQRLENGTWKTIAQTQEGVMALAISDQDQVWVKTKTGVSVLGADGKWIDYPYDPAMYDENYPISPVSNLVVDQRGRVWTGSMWGLYMLDPQGVWRKYNVTDAGLVRNDSTLISDQVNYLLIDKDQRLWIVADKTTIMGDLVGSIIGVVDLGKIP